MNYMNFRLTYLSVRRCSFLTIAFTNFCFSNRKKNAIEHTWIEIVKKVPFRFNWKLKMLQCMWSIVIPFNHKFSENHLNQRKIEIQNKTNTKTIFFSRKHFGITRRWSVRNSLFGGKAFINYFTMQINPCKTMRVISFLCRVLNTNMLINKVLKKKREIHFHQFQEIDLFILNYFFSFSKWTKTNTKRNL